MTKRRLIIFGILTAFVLGFGGFLIWERYQGYSESLGYKAMEEAYIKTMTEDTYGGKTPQETLDLFVSALRVQDVELASKYFMPDDNMSRAKWVSYLSDVKAKGLMNEMAEDISGAKFSKSIDDIRQQFIISNKDKTDSLLITFILNTYSKVWKIENI